jgi:pimeloyl-ACP methyl ester carboxylesterase/DNA-binding CsgD family transcriptional regulator
MEAPQVRYTSASDGMRIAYIIEGQGDPVVVLPFHHNHVELRWTGTMWVRGLADRYRTLHYDSRGQGLSTRGLTRDPTIEAYTSDLEAALAATGLTRFVMVAYGGFAHVAIKYALANPERVPALVLICTSESHSAWPQAFFLSLAEENWDLFLELELRAPYYSADARAWLLSFFHESASQPDYIRMVRCFAASSVADDLPRIEVPTLVLHAKGQHWLSPEEGVELASRIPGARIVFLDGEIEPDPIMGTRAIRAFLEELPSWADMQGRADETVVTARNLSRRQKEVLAQIAEGRTNREIADALVLSERTVERHVAEIYARLGVRNRAEATAVAMRQPATV